MKRSVACIIACLAVQPAWSQENRERRLAERAHQDREIVYFLQQPETHSFDLYHDYTETRPDASRYVNVVRPGAACRTPPRSSSTPARGSKP